MFDGGILEEGVCIGVYVWGGGGSSFRGGGRIINYELRFFGHEFTRIYTNYEFENIDIMEVEKLERGKWYLYTAGQELLVQIKYVRERINGYVFTDGRMENELHRRDVEENLEDVLNEH